MIGKLKKSRFMLKKIRRDFSAAGRRYTLTDDMHSRLLGEYYFQFLEKRVSQGKDQPLISKFDENGIPINKTYVDVDSKDYVYFPISIGQMGLAVFHTVLQSGSEKDKHRFMKFADWFTEHAEEDPKLGVRWMTDVPLPQYRNPGPWQSAFSQSRGMSILLRAYQLTGDMTYADLAKGALLPFTFAVADGGVTSFTEWGPFYEEYPADVPTLVLNGMVFSLCGVRDFVRVFPKDRLAREVFDQGIQTLRRILPEYDLGYWSRYNLCRAGWYPKTDPATFTYQNLHIVQMQLLYKWTEDPFFQEYADLFESQICMWNQIRMYVTKYFALRKIGRI